MQAIVENGGGGPRSTNKEFIYVRNMYVHAINVPVFRAVADPEISERGRTNRHEI